MPNLYDIAYGSGLVLFAPVWLALPKARRKVLNSFRLWRGKLVQPRFGANPTVLIHAVSLGEINATRALVRQLADARPELRFVITVTTDTGHARGQQLYGADPNVTLVRFPLDFTGPVRRLLDSLRPTLVVLMELEVWPNFIYQCRRRGVPVLLVNGRLTESSFRGYHKARLLLARTFRRLRLVCAQDQAYADRFVALGTPADRVRVTGTMKFDTAQIADTIEGAADLARAVGLPTNAPATGGDPVWACGSTGPGEEEVVLRCYRALLTSHPRLRLVIVPRHPERFDAVADLIRAADFPLVRRSGTVNGGDREDSPSPIPEAAHAGGARPAGIPPVSQAPPEQTPPAGTPNVAPADFAPARPAPPVVLGDTMGELRKFYSLSTVVLVGRSLVDLGPRQHGSDMIEPAALAKPVIVGPFTRNFAEVVARFVEADAIRVVDGGERSLTGAVRAVLDDPALAAQAGRRAQDVVRRERGATARHAEVILAELARVEGNRAVTA